MPMETYLLKSNKEYFYERKEKSRHHRLRKARFVILGKRYAYLCEQLSRKAPICMVI